MAKSLSKSTTKKWLVIKLYFSVLLRNKRKKALNFIQKSAFSLLRNSSKKYFRKYTPFVIINYIKIF